MLVGAKAARRGLLRAARGLLADGAAEVLPVARLAQDVFRRDAHDAARLSKKYGRAPELCGAEELAQGCFECSGVVRAADPVRFTLSARRRANDASQGVLSRGGCANAAPRLRSPKLCAEHIVILDANPHFFKTLARHRESIETARRQPTLRRAHTQQPRL